MEFLQIGLPNRHYYIKQKLRSLFFFFKLINLNAPNGILE
jgi:hypothetical protein